jgi:hypothetical protein
LWKEKYRYPTFFGGITSFNSETYEKINGYPNDFFGWGGEDDAICIRMVLNNISVYKLETNNNISITEMTHKNTSDIDELVNTQKMNNLIKDMNNWKNNGLSNLKYKNKNVDFINYDNVIKYTVEI